MNPTAPKSDPAFSGASWYVADLDRVLQVSYVVTQWQGAGMNCGWGANRRSTLMEDREARLRGVNVNLCSAQAFRIRTTDNIVFQPRVVAGAPKSSSIRPR